jgi:hypothetical protein
MKKLLIILLASVSFVAFAQRHGHVPHGHVPHHSHGKWRHSSHGWEWIVPTIIGGMIVWQVTRPPEPIVIQQPPPVLITQPQPNCSPWTEIQNADGTITRTRTCQN